MKLGGALPLFPVSLPLTLSALFSSSLSFRCDLLLTTNYQKKKRKNILEYPVGRIARNAWKTVGINDASFLSLAKHAARDGEGRLVVIFFLLCARCSCRTCHEILGDSIKRLPSGLLGDRPKPAANIHLPFSPLISRHYRTASFQSDSAGESPFGLCCPLHTIKVDGPDLENGRAHEIER